MVCFRCKPSLIVWWNMSIKSFVYFFCGIILLLRTANVANAGQKSWQVFLIIYVQDRKEGGRSVVRSLGLAAYEVGGGVSRISLSVLGSTFSLTRRRMFGKFFGSFMIQTTKFKKVENFCIYTWSSKIFSRASLWNETYQSSHGHWTWTCKFTAGPSVLQHI